MIEHGPPNELKPRPDPKVIGYTGAHLQLTLHASVGTVKTGTPLRNDAGSWVVDEDGLQATMITATFGHGGDRVHAYQGITMDIGKNPRERGEEGFYGQDRLSVLDIDDTGYVSFKRDPNGRWVALTDTVIVMNADRR